MKIGGYLILSLSKFHYSKAWVFFVIPSLIRRHSELLGIEILLNTQTPENDNFTTKVFWVCEGLLKPKNLWMWWFHMKTFNVSCIPCFPQYPRQFFIWNHARVLGIEVLLHTPKPWMWSILMRQYAGIRVLLNWNVLKKLDSHSMGLWWMLFESVVGIIREICTHAFDSELEIIFFGVISKLAQTQTLGFPSQLFCV